MENRKATRYRNFAQVMTCALIGDCAGFLLFLIGAGLGIAWLKIVSVVWIVGASVLPLVSLYLTGEIFRKRSRYLAVGFAAVLLCMLVSLIADYPSPGPVSEPVSTYLPRFFL